MIVDFATGSLYKPDIREEGVSKHNYKRYNYNVQLPQTLQQNFQKNNQSLDVVHLKSGISYSGIIIEEIPNISLKIQTKDLKVYEVKIEEIAKISKENSNL